jgi:hypothetical protein
MTPYRPSASRSWLFSRADAVATAELAGEPGFQGLGVDRWVRVGIAEATSSWPDASPLANECALAEQGRLDRQYVVAGHVSAFVTSVEHAHLEGPDRAGIGAVHALIITPPGIQPIME